MLESMQSYTFEAKHGINIFHRLLRDLSVNTSSIRGRFLYLLTLLLLYWLGPILRKSRSMLTPALLSRILAQKVTA